MTNGRRCSGHGERDFTTAYRPGLGLLCSACWLDAKSSTVKQVPVPEKVEQDRYAQLAAKYGVR